MKTEKKKSKFDPALVEQLRAKHGELFELTEGGETVLVKRPSRADYRKFRHDRMDDKRREFAAEELFEACLVHPELDEFDAVLDRKPALADLFGHVISEIAGGTDPEGK